MPNCFQLIRDGAPVPLTQVDLAICAYLDVSADPELWVEGWYDFIGRLLACGRTFAEIADRLQVRSDWEMLRICHFLNEHYTAHAWAEIGK